MSIHDLLDQQERIVLAIGEKTLKHANDPGCTREYVHSLTPAVDKWLSLKLHAIAELSRGPCNINARCCIRLYDRARGHRADAGV